MIGGQPFRILPAAPPDAFKTYAVSSPVATHTRVATCREVECQHYLAGWVTTVDLGTDLGKRQAGYIAAKSGRAFTREGVPGTMLMRFTFPPGQKCFSEHRVPLDRPALYVVRGGDWRGNPRGDTRLFKRAEDWVDDFAEHQSKIIQARGRG